MAKIRKKTVEYKEMLKKSKNQKNTDVIPLRDDICLTKKLRMSSLKGMTSVPHLKGMISVSLQLI